MQLDKISLLYLINSLDLGGAEKSTILYANRFIHELQHISIFSKEGFYSEKGIIDQNISVFKTFKPGILNFLKNLLTINQIIKLKQVNLLVYHHRKFFIYAFLISLLFKKVRIIYVAQNYFNDFRNRLLFAHSYVALTDEVYNDLHNHGKKNIVIIPHRIEINEKVIHNSVFNIGYVGRYEKDKGISTLLFAFKHLIIKYPKIKLIFRGKGKQEPLIKNFVSKNKLVKSVIIDTPKMEITEIYKDIGILVLPSLKFEGQGIVLIEAMNLGIPVIGSNVGGIKNVIKNNYNGLLFISGNFTDLVEKITNLIENRDLYLSLITNGKTDVKNNYNIEQTIEDYYKLFKKI